MFGSFRKLHLGAVQNCGGARGGGDCLSRSLRWRLPPAGAALSAAGAAGRPAGEQRLRGASPPLWAGPSAAPGALCQLPALRPGGGAVLAPAAGGGERGYERPGPGLPWPRGPGLSSPLSGRSGRGGEWQPGIESDPLSRLLRGLGCLMPRSNESLNRRDNFLHMGKRARTRRQSPELAYLRLFFTFYRQLQGGGKIEGEEEKQKDHVVKQVGGFDRRSEKAAGAPGGEAAGAALRPAEGSGRGRGRPGEGSLPAAAGKGRRGQAGAWLSA